MKQVTFNPFLGNFDFTNDGRITTNTKANILASTATLGTLAYSTDTNELYVYDSTASQWKKVPLVLVTQSPSPDMGYTQISSVIGINPPSTTTAGDGSISDYALTNCYIGSQGIAQNGGIRFYNGYLQVYANSTWNNVVIGFTFSELAGYGYCLTHQPTGLTFPLEVMSGNSITNLSLSGYPVTQGYITDMGAYSSCQSVGGRVI